ncbi:MAG: ferrous iron transporter B, partial [Gammaproteobacteria bacterium]|nr:ferrous iron transporter B [Gammaproteobacteria bacterium]
MNGPTHTVALIGNPNCGKTTLFNALTGAHQHIGNWPGVTVERKSGSYRHAGAVIEIVDLPGTYSLDGDGTTGALDEQIARAFLAGAEADVVVNVVDASSLARGLYLTTQLQNLGTPIVVALNMMDVADRQGLHIDPAKLSAALGCPVVPMVASRREGLLLLGKVLKDVLNEQLDSGQVTVPVIAQASDSVARYRAIDDIVATSVRSTPIRRSVTDVIDAIVLNRYLALPIFLAVMYLMFMFTINIGSAFIDFFDIAGSALFVDGPRGIYDALAFPGWLSTFLADGVGGGIQLVGTFIPIIGCLFLFLAFLEDSGYMGRVAFLLDRAMQQLGLPGKSFVPLIVGFGCNVPAIMATRTLDNRPDRILTTI